MIRSGNWRRAAQIILLSTTVIVAAACTSVAPPAPHRATGITYYVSPSGNDAAAGTSPATAWRTLRRTSQAILRPGDRLLLQGGQLFPGQLTIGPGDAGEAARPLLIGSYGQGPATITSARFAIYVHDTAGIRITGLNLVSQPSASNLPGQQAGGGDGAGVNVYNDLSAGHRLDHVVIDHVYASGFGSGIAFGGANSGAGFSDVQVSDCLVRGNIDSGLESYGPRFDAQSPTYANQNVTVSDVVASENHGDPKVTSHNTGNGIVLGSVRDGSIAWSTADNNGGAGDAAQGPTGIWFYDSTDVSIEHSLAYGNQTANKADGNGFGLDQNTSDSIMQDDLSYDNAGAGFLVYSSLNNGAQKNNVVRYDISSGDSSDGSETDGGISVVGAVAHADVYQNTVVMTSGSGPPPSALRLGSAVYPITARNNIFAVDTGAIVSDTRAVPTATVVLQGNDYYSAAGHWSIEWGATAYHSLASWRTATSEETVAGQKTGGTVNPDLTGPVLGLQMDVATSQPGAGNGFVLRVGSPLLGAGLALARFGLKPGSVNYGEKQTSALHPNVGAQ